MFATRLLYEFKQSPFQRKSVTAQTGTKYETRQTKTSWLSQKTVKVNIYMNNFSRKEVNLSFQMVCVSVTVEVTNVTGSLRSFLSYNERLMDGFHTIDHFHG